MWQLSGIFCFQFVWECGETQKKNEFHLSKTFCLTLLRRREEMSKQGHNPRDLSRLWQRFVKQAKPFRKEMHGLKKQFCLKRLINLLMIVSGKKFLVLRLAISFVFPESSKTSMASSAWKRHKQRTASYSQSLPKDRKHSAKFPLNCAQTIPLAGWWAYLSKKIGFIEQDSCISQNTNN